MKNLDDVFRDVWVRTIIGICLCALLVGVGGPYLGLGDHQPLAGVSARVACILVIALVWVGIVLLRRWMAMRRTQLMGDDLAAQDDSRRRDVEARFHAEHDGLHARFIEALALLRKRRDSGGRLEELPWYLLIGAPGSGKSTLLENSGLEFPLLGSTGNRSVSGIGGTRQCDWWFTDKAVFLDTAGRYTTQDSDPGVDAPAWQAFLQLLRRYRRARPLNGVLVTVSVAELLTMNPAERQRHAEVLRERVDEIGARLGVSLPVYLVFTKLDLVAGFLDHFDTLDATARAQVWGVTFPEEHSVGGKASDLVGDEFDALLELIDGAALPRMHAERDVRRRARILSFPQQLRHLQELALPLCTTVFGGHGYGRAPILRGIYLTSGTQEGTPIDRVLSVVSRSFGMHAATVSASHAPRRTFFIERLLKEVILPESGFAGASPAALRRRRLAASAAIAAMALITAGWIIGMFTSAARNTDFVESVGQVLRDYPDDARPTTPSSLQQYDALALQRLDQLGRAGQLAAQVRAEHPLSMRFGLFEGFALFDQVRDAHIREVNASVVPGLALQFREGVRDAASDPQRLYYALKGYLMLGEPGHRDGRGLALLAHERWREVFPGDDGLADALDGHFRVVLEGRDALRTFPIDSALVETARASLRAADLATLVYGGLKLDSESRQDAPVRLDRTLGLLATVFRRRSGAPLSKPLPALYTRPVFAAMVAEGNAPGSNARGGIASAVAGFVKDDWVFGVKADDPVRRASLAGQVKDLYVADYIRAWDDLIGDLELQPARNVQEASGVAARLAGASSPLKALLALVRDNTTDLLREPSPGGSGRVAGSAAGAATQRADAPIVEHFAALNQLTDGTPGATALDRVLGVLDQMSRTLLTSRPGADGLGQVDPALALVRQEAGQLPPPLSAWLGSLVGTSQALVSKGADSAIADGFRQAAGGDCARLVQGRYPFTADSRSDIPLQDFAALFGNGGRFDGFSRQVLSKSVDTSGVTWSFRDADGARPGGAVLAQAQLADAIRQAYFRAGPAPEVGFTLSITTPPPGIGHLLIEVDGQRFEYKAGESVAPVTMRWPGPVPGLTRISAWDAAGRPLPVLEYAGEWGWFHALDGASLQRRTETRFGANFGFGASHASVDIEASSLHNPFGDTSVRRFRCPA